jgi:glycosyltransferase involved in cell wall biosynthesis
MELSVVVPVYEEEASLPELAERLREACAEFDYEVILVDDGSADGSWEGIEALCAEHATEGSRFRGVRLARNYGKSAALASGFEEARGELVATLDADLQDDPAEIPALIEKLRKGRYDLVSGWKQNREDPWSKTLPSRFFNTVTRLISGIQIHDFNCGLKVYRREVTDAVHVYGELHRYIPLLAKWEGFDRIGERSVEHHARRHGETKFGAERFVRGFLDMVSVVFLTRFATRPMHFFGGLGSMAFAAGFLISLWLSFEKIVLGNPLGDRPLLLFGVLLLLLGAQLFTTGLLGEMIVRPRMEKSPSYQVSERAASGRGSVGERGNGRGDERVSETVGTRS